MSKLLLKVQREIDKSPLSQEEIAEKAGVTQSRISELKNKESLRGTEVLEKVLMALNEKEFKKFVGESS